MSGNEALENINPLVRGRAEERNVLPSEKDDLVHDEIDAREIFDLVRCINDPEHPLTLEELSVVDENNIEVSDAENRIVIQFTPTIPHCSMATLIGLSIRVRLLRALPERFKVDVRVSPGSHQSEHAINKQLADKERIAAALENSSLLDVVNQCLSIKY